MGRDYDEFDELTDALIDMTIGAAQVFKAAQDAYHGVKQAANGYRSLCDSPSKSSDYYLDYSDDDDY